MNENESSILTSLNVKNSNEPKQQNEEMNYNNIYNFFPNDNSNINIINPENKEKEKEELDDDDDLRYKDEFNNNKSKIDSSDPPFQAQFKFSIDLPNVPKQRLHDYLNDDLLNALDVSPNIPNLNSGIQNIKKHENDNIDNNPNSLFGFSLYPSNTENNPNNKNLNLNNLTDYNLQNNQPFLKIGNNNIINNNINNNNNIYNNNNFNNINNNLNFNNINNYNINNNITPNINIDNQQMYIPIQMRNKEQKVKGEKNQKNQKNKDDKKNKFDHSKKNNLKKEGKLKKPFEVRIGDWNCTKCSNLNFSFRSKCNRCGLPKEISNQGREMMPQEIYNQNLNYQMMGNINPNYIYLNNRNDINEIKYYQK